MTVAQDGKEDELERLALPDDRLLDLVEDAVRPLAYLGERDHNDSSCVRSASICGKGMPGAAESVGFGRCRSSHVSSPSTSRAASGLRSRSIPCRMDSRATAALRRRGTSFCLAHTAAAEPTTISRSIR